MTGSSQKSSRAVTFCIILFVLAIIPMFIGGRMSSISTVDFMQIMAAGVALGVMITCIGNHLLTATKQTT